MPPEIISKLGKRLACQFPNLLIILEAMWSPICYLGQETQGNMPEGGKDGKTNRARRASTRRLLKTVEAENKVGMPLGASGPARLFI